MNIKLILNLLLVLALWSCAVKKNEKHDITVFCAASLSPVMEVIKMAWENSNPGQITINAASSGTLARQIENGAPADIFLSASHEWMEYTIEVMQIGEKPKSLARNKLVAIVPFGSVVDSIQFTNIDWIPDGGLVALADPAHVPLGKYTKEALDYFGLYDTLNQSATRTSDARSTLRLVELGEAELGFVYLSDGISSDKVKIVAVLPELSHKAIDYQAVVIDRSNAAAIRFFDFLSSEEAKAVWQNRGFSP